LRAQDERFLKEFIAENLEVQKCNSTPSQNFQVQVRAVMAPAPMLAVSRKSEKMPLKQFCQLSCVFQSGPV